MENNKKVEERRNFLKKAAYAVPTIVAISQITNPTSAEAFKKDPASKVQLVKTQQQVVPDSGSISKSPFSE